MSLKDVKQQRKMEGSSNPAEDGVRDDGKRHRCYLFVREDKGEPYLDCRDKICFLVWTRNRGLVQWKNSERWNVATNRSKNEKIVRSVVLAKEVRALLRSSSEVRFFGVLPKGLCFPNFPNPRPKPEDHPNNATKNLPSNGIIPLKEGPRGRWYLWARDASITAVPFVGHEDDVHFVIWQRKDNETIGWVSWEEPISIRALASKDLHLRNIRRKKWEKARYLFGGRAEHMGKYPGPSEERKVFETVKEDCEKAKKYIEPISESMYLECDFDSMQEEYKFDRDVRPGDPFSYDPDERELWRLWEVWRAMVPRIWKDPSAH